MVTNISLEAWTYRSQIVINLTFNKGDFGNIFLEKCALEARIGGIQRKLQRVDFSSPRILIRDSKDHLECTLLQEEVIWFQNSKEKHVMRDPRDHLDCTLFQV